MTTTLAHETGRRTGSADLDWQPVIFDPSDPDEFEYVQRLQDSNRVWQTTDTLAQQVRDLAETRLRSEQPSPESLRTCEHEITRGIPLDRFGRWVFYPWSGHIVHLLPPTEFRELRLDRNRHKVTRDEQAILDRLTVGVVGLSVGNAVVTTLALEGTCRRIKLADFDHLSLSNLNRIRAGVEAIGLPKAVLAARQMLEIDPYLSLSVWTAGLSPEAIDDFLDGEPVVDLVVDECDDLRLKVMLREAARKRRRPVLMATSDRGMMDVERFDCEPSRPLFHGLVGNLSAADIPAHPIMEEKIKIVTAILGLDTLSTRIGASMLEIGETITTWPQLASDVALGGAAVTTAVRRLALGQPLPSGRRYLDMEELLTADLPRATAAPAAPPSATAAANLDRVPELVQFVVSHGILAPSAGNSQPWRFSWDGEELWVLHDRARSVNTMDGERRTAYVALGAAIENIEIAAASRGYRSRIAPFPCPSDPTVVAKLAFVPNEAASHSAAIRLFPAIARRATNRRLGTGEPLGTAALSALAESVREFGVHLDLRTDAYALAEAGRIAGAADRVRFFHPDLHAELVSELRWSPEAASTTGDGIDLATLELSAAETAAMRLIARPDVVAFLRDLQTAGHAVEELAGKAMRSSSAVALITADGADPGDLLQSGRAIQRFWLTATQLGVAVQPWTTATYLVDLLRTEQVSRFTPTEREALHGLGTQLDRLFPCSAGRPRLMLARLFLADPPSTRALRRPLEHVLGLGSPLVTDPTMEQPNR